MFVVEQIPFVKETKFLAAKKRISKTSWQHKQFLHIVYIGLSTGSITNLVAENFNSSLLDLAKQADPPEAQSVDQQMARQEVQQLA